jgi:hypothetical protein
VSRPWIREETQIRDLKGREGQRSTFDERGGTRVGSFARAIIQHPQAEEAVSQGKEEARPTQSISECLALGYIHRV